MTSSSGSSAAQTPSQRIIALIRAAQDGDTVEYTLKPSQTKLDKKVFETLSDRDVTLVLHLDDGADWTVRGTDLPESGAFTDLDVGVTMDAGDIPADLVDAAVGEKTTVRFTLAHDGAFGFPMTLTVPLGAAHKDQWANLYRYDEETGTLTFQTAVRTDGDGGAALPITGAGRYAVVLDAKSHAFSFADLEDGA